MKFKFVCEHEEGDVVSHEFQKVTLNDVLMRMHDFLKGCGYVFDGTLDIVPDEEMFPPAQIDLQDTDFDEKQFVQGLQKEYRNSDIDPDGRC